MDENAAKYEDNIMGDNVYLSIVIPAYNEESNIAVTLSDISEYLRQKDFACEVIVADDGSRDNTAKEAEGQKGKFNDFRIIKSTPNRGKGYVLRKAILESRGNYVLFMDADNSTSIYEMDKFIPLLRQDADVYIASRRTSGSEVRVPALRKIMGEVYILLSRLILGIGVSDINCGFKLFTKKAAKDGFSKQVMDDWSFDAEVLFICNKQKFRVVEIPVKWEHRDTSKVRPVKDAVRSFVSLVKIKMNDIKGLY